MHLSGKVGLTGLDPSTTYIYTAYTDSSCTTSFDTATFTTFPALAEDLVVSNLNAEGYTVTPGGDWSGAWYYRYGVNLGTLDSQPCTGPITGGLDRTSLHPEVTTHIKMYNVGCSDRPALGYASQRQPYPTYSAAFEATTVTLSIHGWPTRNWWYKRVAPSGDSTCHSVTGGTTSVVLSNLTLGTTYTYDAFRISDCASNNKLHGTASNAITFTMPKLTVEPGSTSAALTLSGWTGQWWYMPIGVYHPTDGTFVRATNRACRGPAQGSITVVRNGLASGYTWGFKAYSTAAACAVDYNYTTINADDSVATDVLGAAPTKADLLGATTLDARAISDGVRLTLGNWGKSDGDWWYRANVIVPHAADNKFHGADGCRGPVTGGNTQANITDLPALVGSSAYYVFTVYPVAGCHYSKAAAYGVVSDGSAVSVSNLSKSNNGNRSVGKDDTFAGQFTTGSNAGGYTLSAVTLDFSAETNPSNKASIGDLTVVIYDEVNGKPGTLLTTLSGSNPKTAGSYDYTCSVGCNLRGGVNYYVIVSAPSVTDTTDAYRWNYTSSHHEDRTPSNNTWSIGNSGYRLASGDYNV